MMESLLCNEVWLLNEVHEYYNVNGIHNCATSPLYSNREDIEQAFISFLEKEVSYMPERVYVKHVKENCLMGSGRSKAICWFVKSQRRLSLSLETVFGAVNYLDRFSSLRNCQVWNDRMFELVSVACLSIASKSYETDPPNLNQIQTEGLEHSFESSLILRMELILLKALDWRLFPTTSYSYIELLKWSLESLNKHLVHEFTALIPELLVKALLDPSFLEFRPCVIALSALDLVSKEFLPTMNDSLCKHFSALIPPDQKDDLIKCCKMMMMMMGEKIVEQCNIAPAKKACINCPSSPVTVLATHYCCHDFFDCQVDLSSLTMKNADFNYFGGSRKKRKKEQQGCCGV